MEKVRKEFIEIAKDKIDDLMFNHAETGGEKVMCVELLHVLASALGMTKEDIQRIIENMESEE